MKKVKSTNIRNYPSFPNMDSSQVPIQKALIQSKKKLFLKKEIYQLKINTPKKK